MIFAGLTLLAIGVADLIRQFLTARRRWIAMLVAAIVLFVAAAGLDAAVWALAAIGVCAVWLLTVPENGSARSGLWPPGVLGVLVAVAVVVGGPRTSTGAFGDLWTVPGPAMQVPADVVVLAIGCVAFLLESANVVVRTALRAEHVALATASDAPAEPEAPTASDAPVRTSPVLKGGRLIGPLERVLVFALMLAGAFTLIAAVFAAKGIVRFPEISRDSDAGDRAEYFLIGSLVSWAIAFAAAFLVWWGAR